MARAPSGGKVMTTNLSPAMRRALLGERPYLRRPAEKSRVTFADKRTGPALVRRGLVEAKVRRYSELDRGAFGRWRGGTRLRSDTSYYLTDEGLALKQRLLAEEGDISRGRRFYTDRQLRGRTRQVRVYPSVSTEIPAVGQTVCLYDAWKDERTAVVTGHSDGHTFMAKVTGGPAAREEESG